MFDVCGTVFQSSVAWLGVYASHVEGDIWNIVDGGGPFGLTVITTMVDGIGVVPVAVAVCELCSTSTTSSYSGRAVPVETS